MILEEFKFFADDDGTDVFGSGEPFHLNTFVSRKIYLYHGDAWKLPVDAIILGQNESLTEKVDGNEAIFNLAGPIFDDSVAELERVATGTAGIVEGGNLGCKHVIFAVGPKYDKNHVDASISALHSSCRAALSLAVENKAKILALNCIYLNNKKYPRWDAAHVVLRTVRRFLERPAGGGGNRIEKVIFCVLSKDDLEIYNTLLPAYFPRNHMEEEEQIGHLPDGGAPIGNEWGTIISEDRQLSITAGPGLQKKYGNNGLGLNPETSAAPVTASAPVTEVVRSASKLTLAAPLLPAPAAPPVISPLGQPPTIHDQKPIVGKDPLTVPVAGNVVAAVTPVFVDPLSVFAHPPKAVGDSVSGTSTSPSLSNSSESSGAANSKPAVLVPPINPNSAFANKVTTGEGKVTLGWPTSTSSLFMMNKPLSNKENLAVQQQAALENNFSKLYEQYAAELHAFEWFKTITPEALATPEHYTEEFTLLIKDISTMETANFLNIVGKDRENRKVVLISIANLKGLFRELELRKVCLYIMRIFNKMSDTPYVIIFTCSDMQDDHKMGLDWLHAVCNLFYTKYFTNLKQIYLLHGSYALRMHIWGKLPAYVKGFWKNYTVTNNLLALNEHMNIKSLLLSQQIIDYDIKHFPIEHIKIYG